MTEHTSTVRAIPTVGRSPLHLRIWQLTYSQAVISWGSKKQVSVALSSCEAEIMAAHPRRPRKLSSSHASRTSSVTAPLSPSIEMGMDNQATVSF